MGLSSYGQTIFTQTYVDRCTGNTQVVVANFVNGSATVGFYNKVRTFTYQEFLSGELQQWLNETYIWWQALSPCSTATSEAQNAQQTAQNATSAAQTASTAASSAASSASTAGSTAGSTATTTGGTTQSTTTGGTTDATSSQTNTTDTSNTTDTNQTSNTESQNTSSSSSSESSQSETGDTSSGGESSESSGGGETSESEGGGTEETSEGSGESEESKTEETSEESKEEEVKEESKEEEKKEEESKEEESDEESSEEESEEESDEESSEKKEEEEKEKKQKKMMPIQLRSDMMANQALLGNYDIVTSIGATQSSIYGDESYGATAMIWSNLRQFSLNTSYTKVHMQKLNISTLPHDNHVHYSTTKDVDSDDPIEPPTPKLTHITSASVGYMNNFGNGTVVANMMKIKPTKYGTLGAGINMANMFGDNTYQVTMIGYNVLYTNQVMLSSRINYAPAFIWSQSPYMGRLEWVQDEWGKNSLQAKNQLRGQRIHGMMILANSFTVQLTRRFSFNMGATFIKSTDPNIPLIKSFMIGAKLPF